MTGKTLFYNNCICFLQRLFLINKKSNNIVFETNATKPFHIKILSNTFVIGTSLC